MYVFVSDIRQGGCMSALGLRVNLRPELRGAENKDIEGVQEWKWQ